MTDAPERIWAFHAPDIEQENLGCTIVAGEKAMPFSTEYIRADLSADHIDALEASNKALVEALRLADAELAAANMNIAVVERKARAAIAEVEGME